MPIDSRNCAACGIVKPLSEFTIAKRNRLGRSYRCRSCVAAYSRNHYWRKHPEGRRRQFYAPAMRTLDWQQVIAEGKMACRICGQIKPLTEFRNANRPHSRCRRECRICEGDANRKYRETRRHHLLKRRIARRCKKYGISPGQFDDMLQKQAGRCAVCGKPLELFGAAIDHDHNTGRVRGITHVACNLVLGNARDDVSVLAGAIRYLWEFYKVNGLNSSELMPIRVSSLEAYK